MYGVGSARSQARMTGLASGLDTESLVQGMTSSIRNKISSQTQTKQTLQWKMDAYRSISSKMIDFNNKFLSYTSSSNMLTSNFYKSATTIAKGANAGAISVSGTSSSVKNLSIVGIGKTASTAGFISRKPVSNSQLKTGSIDFSSTGKEVNNLAGETINITYGGTNYSVKIDDAFTGTSNADVAQAFNDALANIEIDGGTLADKISMSASGGGLELGIVNADDSSALTVIGGSGKALAAIGIELGASTSNESVDGPITGGVTSDINRFLTAQDAAGKTFSIEYNGTRKDVTIGAVASNSREDFLAAVQEGLDKAFGSGRVKAGLTSGDELTFETTNRDGTPDTSSTLTMYYGDSDLIGSKGIFNTDGGLSNRLLLSSSLDSLNLSDALVKDGDVYKMDVNGQTFEFTGDKTLQDVIDTINKSDAGVKIEYLSTTDRFSVTATESGAHGAVNISDSGSSNLASALFGTAGSGADQYAINEGQDAEITISYDGGLTTTTLTRSSNSFDIDGLNIKLNAGVEFDPSTPITFESKTNADDLVKGIKEMVNFYNEIMDLVNSEVSTKPDKKYYPLTSEMKEDMTEKEIETWEAKANSGLLFGDSTLRSLASDMRFAFSFPVPGISDQLSEFGITTGSSYKDNGKITIDEEKLRKAIEERPEDVKNLFTAPKSTAEGATGNDAGIMYRVKDVMDKYVATTGQSKGALINIAGIKDSYYESESRLYKQISDIDKSLEKLAAKQKTQEDRYYKQFTALEKYISQMNAQSSWLYSQ